MNKEISEIRNEWERIEMSGGSNGNFEDIPIPKDWHLDANWPTLLREMPGTRLNHSDDGTTWWVQCYDKRHCTYDYTTGATALGSQDPATVVCAAWLNWKKRKP